MDNVRYKILVIEDDPADAERLDVLLSETRRAAGATCPTPETAKSRLAEEWDAVLLSGSPVESPHDGAVDWLFSADVLLPVVVLVQRDDDTATHDWLRRGAQDVLLKSLLTPESLLRSILHAISRARAHRVPPSGDPRLQFMMEQIPAIVWTTDRSLRITSSAGTLLGDLNLTPGELNGQTLFQYLGSDDSMLEPVRMHRNAIEGQESAGIVHWRHHWYQVHVKPQLSASNTIIGTIGVALDITHQHQIERSIDAARRLQRHLLPASSPKISGFEIAGACYPATECSGDYFDYIPLANGCLGVAVADVSGHGFGPAILAASVRSYLRASAALGKSPHEMLAVTNWLLARDHPMDNFCSLFLAQLDPQTRSFTFAAAGHTGYLMDSAGRAVSLESLSIPLGIEEHTEFTASPTMRLKAGDLMLLVSDGVTEAFSPEEQQFGSTRMLKAAHRSRNHPAAEIVEAVYQAARTFSARAPQRDDMTVVVIKVPADEDDP